MLFEWNINAYGEYILQPDGTSFIYICVMYLPDKSCIATLSSLLVGHHVYIDYPPHKLSEVLEELEEIVKLYFPDCTIEER